jgi:hypothetical protein
MSGHRPLRGALVALAAAAVLTAGYAAPATATTRPHTSAPSTVTAEQKYYWIWSDGSQKSVRTFKQSKYHDQAGLPHLVVTVDPAKPAHTVLLEFKQDGKWILENKVKSDAAGKAVVDINPFCSKNNWCDGTYSYRLKIGSRYATLKIIYAEK